MRIDRFLNGDTNLARGKKDFEKMHRLVQEGKMQFITGGPYARRKEPTKLEQLVAEQNVLLQMLYDRQAEYGELKSQTKGRESYEKSE